MYHLAIDIGASSGRHILGWMENGKICTREVYRFENGVRESGANLTWDVESLVRDVIAGIAECKKIGMIPQTVAIDTWGVDYVLLDENEKEILPVIAYRDRRVEGVPKEVDQILPRKELFARCGIQPLDFNTIYQLVCDKKKRQTRLCQALSDDPRLSFLALDGRDEKRIYQCIHHLLAERGEKNVGLRAS